MTKMQFKIAKFLKTFGFNPKQKRLNDAAVEIQLLRQAEDILGRSVWQNLENIDKYKVNYWDLRKMTERKIEILKKTEEIEAQMKELKKKKERDFEQTNSDGGHDLQGMFSQQSERVKSLINELEGISKIAGNIRRLHDGTVLKLQTLKAENGSPAQIAHEESGLIKLKEKFDILKGQKVDLDTKLAKQQSILKKIERSINAKKTDYRDEATENYELMGKVNKTLSNYRSQLGLIDAKIDEHYAEIGNDISKERYTNAACRKATESKASLCKLIKAIRESINYNYDLSDRA